MHEFGIAEELLAVVNQTVRAHGCRHVTQVVAAVGPGVTEESLLAAFEAAKRGTPAAAAELVVERVGPEVVCLDCATRSALSPQPAGDPAAGSRLSGAVTCPACGGTRALPAAVSEVAVKSIELEV